MTAVPQQCTTCLYSGAISTEQGCGITVPALLIDPLFGKTVYAFTAHF